MKIKFIAASALSIVAGSVLALPVPGSTVYSASGVKYVNGIASCTYGNIKGCQTAAYQGSGSAQAYLDQRIANNPNPNKTTFYNYNPPPKTTTAAKTPAVVKAPSCSPAMQKLYGSDCR